MRNYKTVQELILKAAMFDGITTTIRSTELFGGRDAIELTFSKGDRYSRVCIDTLNTYNYPEDAVLYNCKSALYKLLKAPYEEIEYKKENELCKEQTL